MIFDPITDAILIISTLLGGSILILTTNWRLSIGAQFLLSVGTAISLGEWVNGSVAVMVGVTSGLVCIILFLAAYQAQWRTRLTQARLQFVTPFDQPSFLYRFLHPTKLFIFVLTLIALLTALTLAQKYPLLPLSFLASFFVYWLLCVGMFGLILNQDPLKICQSLFIVLLGFEIWYLALIENPNLLRGFSFVQLLLALVSGYMVVYQGILPEDRV
ncbi:MAG: hypothetical protein AAF629_20305 [Chloroflexota bacterium]